ncbi:MAG: DUF552 domain-containing protein [Synechococcaceae bacterium WBB_32_011]|nr:DUF552 domain-containing protein [Synechococcaceae bacterium WBB_32_011]
MSLFSRLKSVVTGDDYLDSDYDDDLEYDESIDAGEPAPRGGALSMANQFGGTFAIDGHQERVGESIFLFAPSCVTVTTASTEESASPSVISRDTNLEQPAAPSPAWGRTDALNG